jgi:hypothetical protein
MQISVLAEQLLRLVFNLSSSSASLTRPRLEARLGQARGGLNGAFAELSRLGLLDAQRIRLTLAGLAHAVALGAHGRSRRRRPAPQAPLLLARRASIALFSAREAPRAVA